jgi:hypothetical protein
MTIEQAIKKAIEGDRKVSYSGGFSLGNGKWIRCRVLTPKQWAEKYANQIFLDPSFWQSLGNALGWADDERDIEEFVDKHGELPKRARWEIMWHHFIDHLAVGKDATEFFAALDASTHAAPPTIRRDKS